ncbi:MAG: HAMP domain-containing histidine kinase [Gelidibacter sp.]|nr:HAMP domain-containing histidine kinase [Gelidibacter sp.]
MNERKYNSILYFIVITMLLTVAIQGYWNYNTYQENKQRYINDVQIALDNAIEIYYADLAEANQMTIIKSDTLEFNSKSFAINSDSIFSELKEGYKDAIDYDIAGFTQFIDSSHGFNFNGANKELTQVKMFRGKSASDSIKLLKGIKAIFISIHNDTLDLKSLNSILTKELERKKLSIDFALKHYENDSVVNAYNKAKITPDFLKTTAKTKFLKHNETLELNYANATKIILQKGILEILLSFLLILAIISCLFYLLKIIKNQKQLAEVKNDLISNITHEFKTPIATISVALESIKNFKVIDNKEKTKAYVDMSNDQLTKLNVMVEKLLETATLDSDSLQLNKELVDIDDLLHTIVEKHQLQTKEKTIHFTPSAQQLMAKVDVFHFENALNNVLDNAIKYGGNNITISIEQNSFAFTIYISDDGNSLTKANKEKIFEKFYRVPKGNTHDVKGFGIGLYYTKKIIEKHNGAIYLDLENKQTTFKISLPNE